MEAMVYRVLYVRFAHISLKRTGLRDDSRHTAQRLKRYDVPWLQMWFQTTALNYCIIVQRESGRLSEIDWYGGDVVPEFVSVGWSQSNSLKIAFWGLRKITSFLLAGYLFYKFHIGCVIWGVEPPWATRTASVLLGIGSPSLWTVLAEWVTILLKDIPQFGVLRMVVESTVLTHRFKISHGVQLGWNLVTVKALANESLPFSYSSNIHSETQCCL